MSPIVSVECEGNPAEENIPGNFVIQSLANFSQVNADFHDQTPHASIVSTSSQVDGAKILKFVISKATKRSGKPYTIRIRPDETGKVMVDGELVTYEETIESPEQMEIY